MKKLPIQKYKWTNKWNNEIVRVPITRETEHFVFFKNGARSAKLSQGSPLSTGTIFANTKEEVIKYVRKELNAIVVEKRRSYDYAVDKQETFEKYIKIMEEKENA